MEDEKLYKDFLLLKHIINAVDSTDKKVNIDKLEKLIFITLPEALRDNAPSNFPDLYFDFKREYERFKEFIVYDKLIGKNIVALGGGFSSGKSSFLNSLLNHSILPANINPSTSVPAYLVQGEEISACGINTFYNQFALELQDIKAISHGFGRIDENNEEVTLGHILESIFISSPEQPFASIAFLDTPGYSKAETAAYSVKTDEKIARTQLNSSNYILWFVQVDAGTITEEDIDFLQSLRKDIPKLIIINKADKVRLEDLQDIILKIHNVLQMKGIVYLDVVSYSRKKGFPCDKEKILYQLEQWNQAVYENNFAYNFKVLFTKCGEYYSKKLDDEGRRLSRLNKVLTLSENNDVTECLVSLIAEIKRSIANLKAYKETLKLLQNEFFSEIKRIADLVQIQMPEPSEIDLIRDKIVNPKIILDEFCKRKGMKSDSSFVTVLCDTIANVQSVFNKVEGNGEYSKDLE